MHQLAADGIKVFQIRTVEQWQRDFSLACACNPNIASLRGSIRGLLRGDYKEEQARQAIIVLLNLADGHNADPSFFLAKGEKEIEVTIKEFFESPQHFRQQLAEQAWTELCRHVFNPSGRALSHYFGGLTKLDSFGSFSFIERVLEFFNPEPPRRKPNVSPGSKTKDEELALIGILEVLGCLWKPAWTPFLRDNEARVRELQVKSIPVVLAYRFLHRHFSLSGRFGRTWPYPELMRALREKIPQDSAGGRNWLKSGLLDGNEDAQLYQRLRLYEHTLEYVAP